MKTLQEAIQILLDEPSDLFGVNAIELKADMKRLLHEEGAPMMEFLRYTAEFHEMVHPSVARLMDIQAGIMIGQLMRGAQLVEPDGVAS